jgi:N-acetylglucosamine-6-phosphate deacetylase
MIATGYDADIIVFDEDIKVSDIFIAGRKIT